MEINRNLKKNYKKKICDVCGKKFYVKIKLTRGKILPTGVRNRNCKTCSSKCSRERRDFRNGNR